MHQRFQKILKSTHPPMRMASCKAWLGVGGAGGGPSLGIREETVGASPSLHAGLQAGADLCRFTNFGVPLAF